MYCSTFVSPKSRLMALKSSGVRRLYKERSGSLVRPKRLADCPKAVFSALCMFWKIGRSLELCSIYTSLHVRRCLSHLIIFCPRLPAHRLGAIGYATALLWVVGFLRSPRHSRGTTLLQRRQGHGCYLISGVRHLFQVGDQSVVHHHWIVLSLLDHADVKFLIRLLDAEVAFHDALVRQDALDLGSHGMVADFLIGELRHDLT